MNEDVAGLVERLDNLDIKRRTHFSDGVWSLMDGTTIESEAASTIRAQAAEIEDLTGKLEVAMTIVRGAQAAHDAERQHRHKLREAVEVIEFYSAEDNYCAGGLIERHTAGSDDISFDELEQPPVLADEGTRARAFLASYDAERATMEKPRE